MKKSLSVLALASSAAIVACAGTSEKEAKSLPSKNMESVVSEAPKKTDSLPATYKDIVFPEFKYIAPNAADARVKISENITGYVIEDKPLPLIHFNIFFD